MFTRWWDLLVTLLLTAIAAASVSFLTASPLVSFLTLPLVFLLPGYALTAALFARRPLGLVETLLISVGLSLATAVLGGLAMNYTVWGLSTLFWIIVLCGVTLLGCSVAAIRRIGQKSAAAKRPNIGLGPGQVFLLGVSVIVIVGALGMARQGAIAQPSTPFTQLWADPISGAQPNLYNVGIRNEESTPITFRLVATLAGNPAYTWPGITLPPGQTWTGIISVPGGPSNTSPVGLQLYSSDAPDQVYRHITLRQGGN